MTGVQTCALPISAAAAGVVSSAQAQAPHHAAHGKSVTIRVAEGSGELSSPTAVSLTLAISVMAANGNGLFNSSVDLEVEFRHHPNQMNRAIVAAVVAYLHDQANIGVNQNDHVVLFGGAVA